jgi:REP-associated tyrosine transposase
MGELPRLQATPLGGLRYDARACASIVEPPIRCIACTITFVFITKYRKPVLRGEVGTEVRDLIREICRSQDIEVLEGHIRPDHVHLLVSVPPHLAPSRVMQAIKGKTSHHLLMDHRKLRTEFWGRHLWGRGYFVCSSGNVTDETIAEYIRLQGAEPQDDDRFRISEE